MILTLIVVITIYGHTNYYVGRRGAQALATYPRARGFFLILFAVSAMAYPLGRILMSFDRGLPTSVLIVAGSFHLIMMLYGLMAVLLIDCIRLGNAFLGFLPKVLTAHPGPTGLTLFLVAAAGILLAVAFGAVNASRLRTTEAEIRIPKQAGTRMLWKIGVSMDVFSFRGKFFISLLRYG